MAIGKTVVKKIVAKLVTRAIKKKLNCKNCRTDVDELDMTEVDNYVTTNVTVRVTMPKDEFLSSVNKLIEEL